MLRDLLCICRDVEELLASLEHENRKIKQFLFSFFFKLKPAGMDSDEIDRFKAGGSRWGEFEDPVPEKKKIGKVLLEMPPAAPVDHVELEQLNLREKPSSDPAEMEQVLEGTQREQILYCVALNDSAHFKSQQRGEADLSLEEKKAIADSILDSKPSKFLERYGKFLKEQHLSYFDQYCSDYEVDFYRQHLEKSIKQRATVVKNRRYQAMNELIAKGEYFSMNEMQSRNPLLFKHLVEKHMNEEERRVLESEKGTCELSTVLMAHMDRDQYSSVRRREQEAEQKAWEEGASEEEEEDEDKAEMVEQEKTLLQQEFVSTMHRSFLEGRDKDFDYSSVDDDSRYDNIQLQERDEQDRYFDTDE